MPGQNKSVKKVLVAILVCCFAATTWAQDSHYYGQQPDAKGTLDGGTGTAGSREVSAMFYNPGIIALFDESSLGLSGNLYSYDLVRINDGVLPVGGSFFQVIPSMLIGTFKWKNNPKITSTYGYLNTGFYNGRLSGFDLKEGSFQGVESNDFYRADIRTRFTDDWFGGGLSYRINENLGIGAVAFVQSISKIYTQQTSYTILERAGTRELYQWSDGRELRAFSPGVLFNFGLIYHKGNHEFGLNIITPRINVTSLAWSSFQRFYTETDQMGVQHSSALTDPSFLSTIKRPLEVNIGYALMQGMRTFKFRLSYYGGIDPYTMGQSSTSEIRTGIFNQPDAFSFLPIGMVRQVINMGMGYEWHINDKFNLVSGLRSDFTYFDNTDLMFSDFTSVMVHWNIYRASFGFQFEYKWARLHAGLDYGFSFNHKISHVVDFDEVGKPMQDMERNNDAWVTYQQFKVFFGLILAFSR